MIFLTDKLTEVMQQLDSSRLELNDIQTKNKLERERVSPDESEQKDNAKIQLLEEECNKLKTMLIQKTNEKDQLIDSISTENKELNQKLKEERLLLDAAQKTIQSLRKTIEE
jgi:predicted RNase H-like nuclease (RuvC/YqgF family)